MIRIPWRFMVIIGTLVVASGFVEFRIRQYPDYAYTNYIPKVLNGTYGAPAIYRVLVPYFNTWMGDFTGWSPAAVWHVTRLGWFFAAYLITFLYLQTWFSDGIALAGVAGIAATLPLTYTNSWAHPDSIPELALFTLGCLAIVRRTDTLFAVALAVASLNRETAAFLVGAYAFSRPVDGRHMARTAGFFALWASAFFGLRLWRGMEHYDYWQLGRNLTFLKLLPASYDVYKRAYAWFVFVLAGPALAVIAAGWARVPSDARRLLAAALPLALVGLTISSIIETRVFIPLYPLMLPALMFAVLEPKRSSEESLSAV
jgi:hypothetical protein